MSEESAKWAQQINGEGKNRMPNAQDLMRARFAELREQIAAIEAVSTPLRARRDATHAEAQAIADTAKPLDLQILTAEAGLYEAKNELALLSRALRGNTAQPDA